MKPSKLIVVIWLTFSTLIYSQDDKQTQFKKIQEYQTLLRGRWIDKNTKKDALIFQSGKFAEAYAGQKQYELSIYSIKYDTMSLKYFIRKYTNGLMEYEDFYIKNLEASKLELRLRGKLILYIKVAF